MLICMISGMVSASVTLTGPATVTRGGVSDGEPNVDGHFNVSVNGTDTLGVPLHLGVIVNPQVMTGNICDRPPYLIGAYPDSGVFTPGSDALVWPTDPANPYTYSQVSPDGVHPPSVGYWNVPWGGTKYYGSILFSPNAVYENTSVRIGTLYPEENVSTSLKPGEYKYHLQEDSISAPHIPGVNSSDYNVTVTFGNLTAGAYDFTAWSYGSLVPVTSITAGRTVVLQGTNTDNRTTYLWLAGEGQPKCGTLLTPNGITVEESPSGSQGADMNGTWFYQWTPDCSLSGEFTIYASSVRPSDIVPLFHYDKDGCGSYCYEGGICSFADCPTCSPEPAKVTISVVKPDFRFTIPEIVERCCCEAYPCGSTDTTTTINLTGQTGTPGESFKIWIFGNGWLGQNKYLGYTATSATDVSGSYSLDLRTIFAENDVRLCDLDAGEYHVVIQLRGCNSEVLECSPGDLVGYDAYKAFMKCLHSDCTLCHEVSDRYIDLKFTIRDRCNGGSVDFNGTPVSGYAPMTVQFSDVSTYKGTSYLWLFGDNATSVEQNPVHEYTAPGAYDVTFKVTNGTDTREQTKMEYITVLDPSAQYGLPVANFTYVPKTAEPMTIQFIDQSYGATNLTYLWDFGDGSVSTDKVPAHTYSAQATYDVSLKVTDTYGKNSTATQAIVVPAKPSSLPEIDFTADVTGGEFPLTVQFLDSTVTTWADSWQWNFGDGATSSLRSPIHVYSTPGLYTVTLRASNVNGEGSEMTKPGYIKVQNQAPVITASADPMNGTFPLRVEFTATATVNNKTVEQSKPLIQSWLWDFGDGSISAEQNPVHVYEKPGNYPVTVECSLYDGVSGTKDAGIIEVGPIPYANFYWEYLDKDDTCCYLVKFTDTSIGATSWSWDFGDGLTSDEQNPTHRYKEVGSYNVTLTVDDGTGTTSVMTQTVQITAGYTTPTPTPTPAVPGVVEAIFYSTAVGTRTIEFTDQSTGLIAGSSSWLWDFGDATSSTEQNPTHLYPKDGEYTVVLKVSNGKFSDSVSQTIGVR